MRSTRAFFRVFMAAMALSFLGCGGGAAQGPGNAGASGATGGGGAGKTTSPDPCAPFDFVFPPREGIVGFVAADEANVYFVQSDTFLASTSPRSARTA